jgi:hypothetical protein
LRLTGAPAALGTALSSDFPGPGPLPLSLAGVVSQETFYALSNGPPGTPLSLAAYLGGTSTAGGTQLSASAPYTAPLGPVATVRAVLKTPTLYADQGVVALAYTVADAVGGAGRRPQLCGRRGGEHLLWLRGRCGLHQRGRGPGAPARSPCPRRPSGRRRLGRRWSPMSYWGVVVATAAAVTFAVAPPPALPPPAAVGGYARLPVSPRYGGDTLSVAIDVLTGPDVLTTWQINVAYDAAALAYVAGSAARPVQQAPGERGARPGQRGRRGRPRHHARSGSDAAPSPRR